MVFLMLLQYLNCVFNMQSQHGIWEMLQHFLPNTEKWIKVFILPSSSSEACIVDTSGYRLISTSTSAPNEGFFRDSSKLCIARSITLIVSDSN